MSWSSVSDLDLVTSPSPVPIFQLEESTKFENSQISYSYLNLYDRENVTSNHAVLSLSKHIVPLPMLTTALFLQS